MKFKLKRIDPVQTGKILGLIYGLFSLLFVPFMAAFMFVGSLASRAQGAHGPALPLVAGLGAGFMLLLPLMYAAIGFVGGVIGAWIYNLVARWVGGLEIELENDAAPPAVPVPSAPPAS